MKPPYAFRVSDPDEYSDSAAIVFAWTESDAQSRGNINFWVDFDELHTIPVQREPQYDQYAPLGYVPPVKLIKDGWHLPCDCCGTMVDADSENDDTGEFHEYCQDGQFFYCSPECKDSHKSRMAQSKIIRQQVKAVLASKYKGIRAISVHVNTDEVVAWFQFPGGHRRAKWVSCDPEYVTIVKPDLGAWESAFGKVVEVTEIQ
jgi:hypothetical protein